MSSHDVGPHSPCPNCGQNDFARKITAPQVYVSGGGSANNPWPIRVKSMPHRGFDKDGRAAIIRDEVVFHNKQEQDAYMKEHGLARYCDQEDSAVTDSQHHVKNQGDDEAPTPRAAEMAKQSFFVEDPAPFL
jgi:hypothetical protein